MTMTMCRPTGERLHASLGGRQQKNHSHKLVERSLDAYCWAKRASDRPPRSQGFCAVKCCPAKTALPYPRSKSLPSPYEVCPHFLRFRLHAACVVACVRGLVAFAGIPSFSVGDSRPRWVIILLSSSITKQHKSWCSGTSIVCYVAAIVQHLPLFRRFLRAIDGSRRG